LRVQAGFSRADLLSMIDPKHLEFGYVTVLIDDFHESS